MRSELREATRSHKSDFDFAHINGDAAEELEHGRSQSRNLLHRMHLAAHCRRSSEAVADERCEGRANSSVRERHVASNNDLKFTIGGLNRFIMRRVARRRELSISGFSASPVRRLFSRLLARIRTGTQTTPTMAPTLTLTCHTAD